MNNTAFKIIKFNSKEFWEIVRLREIVLRLPLYKRFSYDEILSEKDQLIVGMYSDQQLLGSMQFIQKKDQYKMRQVVIHPNFQNKNLGSRLLEFCEAYIQKYGGKKMYCHARDTAKNFYLKNGYHIKGNSFLEIDIKHWEMWKNLS